MQNAMVLKHLQQRGAITPHEALELYGVMRLGARIYDLRHKGYEITREMVTVKNRFNEYTRFARYTLVRKDGNNYDGDI